MQESEDGRLRPQKHWQHSNPQKDLLQIFSSDDPLLWLFQCIGICKGGLKHKKCFKWVGSVYFLDLWRLYRGYVAMLGIYPLMHVVLMRFWPPFIQSHSVALHNTTVGSKTKDLKELAFFGLTPLTSVHLITPTHCHWIGVLFASTIKSSSRRGSDGWVVRESGY